MGKWSRLKSLKAALESDIATLQGQREVIKNKIANNTVTDVELQRLELLADQIAAKTWDLQCVLGELGGLI